MADQEQLDILKQGAGAWNVWRVCHARCELDLSNTDLSNIDLSHANLSSVNFSSTDLTYASLGYVNLVKSCLHGTYLYGANLSYANLSYANLSYADLRETNLSYADLHNANFSDSTIGWTIFGNIDLRAVKNLETITHQGPSYISTSTLERSQGKIPEKFLKGAGVSDTLIVYAHSLFNNPIEYYTCFISYSSKDELFARRLHNDLQQEGVRCWFAPEHMDIGDKIKHRIDESIRLYDKLLLILSEHSITSIWVEYEVERALKKEPHGIQNVLYPGRVDQTILTCTTDWARDIKETRHIGDFEHWINPQHYVASFQRLLRALNQKKKKRS